MFPCMSEINAICVNEPASKLRLFLNCCGYGLVNPLIHHMRLEARDGLPSAIHVDSISIEYIRMPHDPARFAAGP